MEVWEPRVAETQFLTNLLISLAVELRPTFYYYPLKGADHHRRTCTLINIGYEGRGRSGGDAISCRYANWRLLTRVCSRRFSFCKQRSLRKGREKGKTGSSAFVRIRAELLRQVSGEGGNRLNTTVCDAQSISQRRPTLHDFTVEGQSVSHLGSCHQT